MTELDRIAVNPEVMNGQPCIRGTRLTVRRVLEILATYANRADVLADGGFKPGSKSMGVNACVDACRFVLAETPTRTIVDPFCGWGTVLAVANMLGMEAIGVDLSARMVRKARALRIDRADMAGDRRRADE